MTTSLLSPGTAADLDRSARHGLTAMASVPPALQAELEARRKAQESVARIRLGMAAEVARALEDAGVRAVFVKGVAMALSVYERPGERPFNDVDVLVEPAGFAKARRAIEALGFARETGLPPSPAEETYRRERVAGVVEWVDLHHAFSGPDGLQAHVRVPVGEVIARARGELPVPALEDSLLLAAANLARKGVNRLVLVTDFERMAARGPDWEVVVGRAREWRLTVPLWVGLRLAGGPSEVLRHLAPSPWRRRLLERLMSPRLLAKTERSERPAYRLLFRALCVDEVGPCVRAIVRRACGVGA